MKLRVVAEQGVVAGHRQRLPGEVFEVPEKLGRVLLAQHPDGLVSADVLAAETTVAATSEDLAPVVVQAEPEPVSTLDLSSRVLDALEPNDIRTVTDLRLVLARGDAAMLALPGIGKRALAELKVAVGTDQSIDVFVEAERA